MKQKQTRLLIGITLVTMTVTAAFLGLGARKSLATESAPQPPRASIHTILNSAIRARSALGLEVRNIQKSFNNHRSSVGQTLDIQGILLLNATSSAVQTLSIIASSPSNSTIEVYYRGNRLGSAQPLTSEPTSLPPYQINDSVTEKGDLVVKFSGAYSLANVSVNYTVPTPPVTPPFPPIPPQIPPCAVLGYGLQTEVPFNYRIGIEQGIVVATDDFADFTTQLQGLLNGRCYLPQPVVAQCSIAGSGSIGGFPYKYRLLLDGNPLVGTEDFALFTDRLTTLKRLNVCNTQPTNPCALYPGDEAGTYKVAIGSSVIDIVATTDAGQAKLKEYRDLGLCLP